MIVTGRFIKTVRIEEEWYEDVNEPELMVKEIKNGGIKADIFTFWQRYPETKPKHNYYMEFEKLAVLNIKSYDHWWKKQIKSRTRGLIRKAEKKGVVVKETDFNDDFVRGITNIFNETPIRQGRPFWHYGKSFESVKQEFSRNLSREGLIGAYYGDELIGFIFLTNALKYAVPAQIISSLKHREKAPNNALIAKAVELCEKEGLQYLVYFYWDDSTLSEFKRRNGFVKVVVPRYYLPLTLKGRIILSLQLHRGLTSIMPDRIVNLLKQLRKRYYFRRYKSI